MVNISGFAFLQQNLTLALSSWQRNFSMSVNSAAVLRLTGRGGGTVVGAPRGRSSSRGRGELLLVACAAMSAGDPG